MITGLHHVSMKCGTPEKLERAKAFYRDVLGLPIKREWSEGIMIDTGDGLIEIFSSGEGETRKGAVRHFALATDRVDVDAGRIRDAGYQISIGPKEVVLDPVAGYSARIAFCVGPLGEEIELFQEL